MPDRSGLKHSAQIERLYLVGFMGAGKTSVGTLLAPLLGWQFFDVDKWLEEVHRQPVATLFANHGEAGFRVMEQHAVQTLGSETQAVISLGGGAIETEAVRSMMEQDAASQTIFLEAPLQLLVDRCLAQDGAHKRPLLAHVELLGDRYEKRLAFYRKAHHTVATQNLTPEEVAAAIHAHMAASERWN